MFVSAARRASRAKYWLVVLFTVVLLSAIPLYSSAKPIELRFAYSMPRGVAPSNGYEWFGKELEKRSQGRVRVLFFPGESLLKVKDAYDSVMAGVVQIANVSMKNEVRRMPLSEVFTLPTTTFPDTAKGGTAACNGVMAVFREFPEIQAEWGGVKLLFVSNMPNEVLHSKRQIRLPGDFKGKKIGSTGAVAEFVALLGGVPVYITGPDAYLSVKSGVVDAQAGSWSLCYTYKLWEVTKYHLEHGLGQNIQAVVMNRNSWNALPADIQDMINELGAQAMALGAEGLAERVNKGKKQAAAYGNTIISLTAAERKTWAEAGKPMEDEWIKKNQSKVGTARKILARFKLLADESWK
jgi:TRAP-type transport system periplasmic protein